MTPIQVPLALFQMLSLLAGGNGDHAPPAGAQEPAAAGINPAVLAAVLAAAVQRPAGPAPDAPPEQKGGGIVEGVVIAAFVLAMFGTAGLGIYMQSPITALAVLAFGLGVLASKFGTVVDFRFGSSWGSRQKDGWRPREGQGAPVVITAPDGPALPAPAPGEPETDGTERSEPPVPSILGVGPSTDQSTANLRSDVPHDGRAASIRYHNPGAQYPSERAAAFGQIGYGVIGGGHKIARFPHPVNGAAANLDLLKRKYVGMEIGAAGKKWTGANSFGVPGYPDAGTLTAEMIDDPSLAIPFMKAIAKREAGRESPITEAEWQAAHAMFKAGSADAYLSGVKPPTVKLPTGADLLAIAKPHIGEKYVFGVQVPKDNASYKGPWDCAEFVSWVIYQVAKIPYGWTDDSVVPAKGDAYSGAFQRDAQSKGRMVSVQQAASTPGGILLRYPNGGVGHVVLCDGHGGTVEAKSTAEGVVADKVSGRRWDTGLLILGISYGESAAVAIKPPERLYAVGQPNMSATVITAIQTVLAEKGFTVTVDGEYGPETAAAVAAFQRQSGLVEDGEVGPQTAAALGVTL